MRSKPQPPLEISDNLFSRVVNPWSVAPSRPTSSGYEFADELPQLTSPNPYPNGVGAIVKKPYPDAKCVMSFVDGHVSFIKIYWNGASFPMAYETVQGYDYDWDVD